MEIFAVIYTSLFTLVCMVMSFSAATTEAILDAGQWEKQIPIDYYESTVARVKVIGVMSCIIALLNIPMIFTSFFLLGTIYWVTFDIGINLYKGMPWYYVGKTAKLDKLLKSMWIKIPLWAILLFGSGYLHVILITSKHVTIVDFLKPIFE